MITAQRILVLGGIAASIVSASWSGSSAAAQNTAAISANVARVVDYWTPERRANAIPRDLVIDPRGLGYLRLPNGNLLPYGHNIAAQAAPEPRGKPTAGGSSDPNPPVIDEASRVPANGAVLTATTITFSAKVTDTDSGVKSVTVTIQYPDGSFSQAFSATKGANDIWSVTLQGFADSPSWGWRVDAKDNAPRGGNTATSLIFGFKVDTNSAGGGGGGGGSDTIANAEWTSGGKVQTAAGRLYFEMPGNRKRTKWWGYVCSGTVANDGSSTNGRSVIITAAHCVYDDVNKAFARNVMFIPDQAHTDTGSNTDRNCFNDPMGCWVPSLGVVDVNWTTRTFPSNVTWDYAYYVVNDADAHHGRGSEGVLDSPGAAGSLWINFNRPQFNDGVAGATSADFTYGLGYTYSYDPKFMYCAEDMTEEPSDPAANWWLPSCGLGGGSSGGPWLQGPLTAPIGNRDIISVNSWGYTNSPGMAGPKLFGTSAECIFDITKSPTLSLSPRAEGEGETVKTCP